MERNVGGIGGGGGEGGYSVDHSVGSNVQRSLPCSGIFATIACIVVADTAASDACFSCGAVAFC